MGRKPSKKVRAENPALKKQWVRILMPLYMQGGLNKSTMEEISRHLGVAKATLYKYYESKNDIVSDVVDMKIMEILAFEQLLFDESVSYIERYNSAVEHASLRLTGISADFLSYLKVQFPHLWQKIDFMLDTTAKRLEDFYALGIKLGYLNDVNPKLCALVDKIFITALSDPQFLSYNELSLHESLKEYFSMKSKGIFKIDSLEYER